MASYPSSTKTYTTKSDGESVYASHVNELQDEIVALENGLRVGLAHHAVPATTNLYDVGTAALRWRNLIAQTLTIDTDTLTVDATASTVGVGTTAPTRRLHLRGTGTATAPSDAGSKAGTLLLQDAAGGAGNGGALEFASSQGYFAALKGLLVDGGNNTRGDLGVYVRAATADVVLTEVARWTYALDFKLAGAIFERGRTVALGEWTAVAFDEGNFTGSGTMTWTLESADQVTYAYTLTGKTATVSFYLNATTVGGSLSTELRVALPAGITVKAGKSFRVPLVVSDNGVARNGVLEAVGGLTHLKCYIGVGGGNWAASTNNTQVAGEIRFEIT